MFQIHRNRQTDIRFMMTMTTIDISAYTWVHAQYQKKNENTCLFHFVLILNVSVWVCFLLNSRLNCRFVVYLFLSLLLLRGIVPAGSCGFGWNLKHRYNNVKFEIRIESSKAVFSVVYIYLWNQPIALGILFYFIFCYSSNIYNSHTHKHPKLPRAGKYMCKHLILCVT